MSRRVRRFLVRAHLLMCSAPLHWAASAGSIVSMRTRVHTLCALPPLILDPKKKKKDLLLTTGGANLRATDAREYSALHHAAQYASMMSENRSDACH